MKRKHSAHSEDTGDEEHDVDADVRRCTQCQASETPQWREGPLGPKSLCNACGVKWLRHVKKARGDPARNGNSNGKAASHAPRTQSPRMSRLQHESHQPSSFQSAPSSTTHMSMAVQAAAQSLLFIASMEGRSSLEASAAMRSHAGAVTQANATAASSSQTAADGAACPPMLRSHSDGLGALSLFKPSQASLQLFKPSAPGSPAKVPSPEASQQGHGKGSDAAAPQEPQPCAMAAAEPAEAQHEKTVSGSSTNSSANNPSSSANSNGHPPTCAEPCAAPLGEAGACSPHNAAGGSGSGFGSATAAQAALRAPAAKPKPMALFLQLAADLCGPVDPAVLAGAQVSEQELRRVEELNEALVRARTQLKAADAARAAVDKLLQGWHTKVQALKAKADPDLRLMVHVVREIQAAQAAVAGMGGDGRLAARRAASAAAVSAAVAAAAQEGLH